MTKSQAALPNATRIWWTYQLAAAQAVLVAQTASLLYRSAASLRGVGWVRRARTYDALPTGQSAKQQVGQPALLPGEIDKIRGSLTPTLSHPMGEGARRASEGTFPR